MPASFPQYLTILFALMSAAAIAQGTYDEKPLRGNLADLPFAQTSLGRESHRFAHADVNRFRIYDFYKRQAQWHLEHPSSEEKRLLPFTGLDGGRRGHWGVTNEVSIQAMKRQKLPIFPTKLSRGEHGIQYLSSPENEVVLVYDVRLPGVRRVLTNGRLLSPPGPFRGAVDGWGFSVQAQGDEWMQASACEWSAGQEALTHRSDHHSAGEIAFRHQLGNAELLEQITFHGKGDDLVMVRRFSFMKGMPRLHFKPLGALVHRKMPAGVLLAPAQEGEIHHLLTTGGGVEMDFDDEHKAFLLESEATEGWLEIRSWKGIREAEEVERISQLPARDPRETVSHKKPSFPQVLVTQGRINADPAAATAAYQIDDIEIPFDNPWHQPMTLSGIDFDQNGIAYVCTMVGDVWRIEGLDHTLREVKWRRFASGLNLPMGLVVVDGTPFVSCRKQIIKLHDHNQDGEADEYETFNRVDLPLGADNGGDLRRDENGVFYRNGGAGVFSISADGTQIKQVGSGSRNPLGIGVRADGLVLSDSSEGENYNGTCTIFESMHPENANSLSKKKRILYLPRGIDSSPGSRLFLNDSRFGPLGDAMIGLSFGTGSWYQILRDENEGTPQAALHALPGEFASGVMRLAKNPVDGQIYCVGLDGWGDYAVKEGCFHRMRFTGKETLIPLSWHAHRNGIMMRFSQPISVYTLNPNHFFAQQWNTVDYRMTYGSADYSVRSPQEIGHDRLIISRILPGMDPNVVFFEIPDLRPAMYTHLYGRFVARSGDVLDLDFYATINRLRADYSAAIASAPAKPDTLVVREEEQNGNTYEVLTGFFDRIAGRDAAKRAVAEEIPWSKNTIDYEWVRSQVIEPKCIMCHQAGTPHDLSTYEKISAKVVSGNPVKSHLIGQLKTGTMPPYPMPLLHSSTIEALEYWIKEGLPRERK